jgi:hypothetical protein
MVPLKNLQRVEAAVACLRVTGITAHDNESTVLTNRQRIYAPCERVEGPDTCSPASPRAGSRVAVSDEHRVARIDGNGRNCAVHL